MATTNAPARPLLPALPGFRVDLDGRRPLAHVGPNWFATVMGTGIVANAAATLPVDVPGLLVAVRGIWVLDVVLLVSSPRPRPPTGGPTPRRPGDTWPTRRCGTSTARPRWR